MYREIIFSAVAARIGPWIRTNAHTRKTIPHMQAFWAATLSFTMAFIGWFAFVPLMGVVRQDIEICDNDEQNRPKAENL